MYDVQHEGFQSDCSHRKEKDKMLSPGGRRELLVVGWGFILILVPLLLLHRSLLPTDSNL